MIPKGEFSHPGQQQLVEQRRQAGSQVEEVPEVPVVVAVVEAQPDGEQWVTLTPSGFVACDSRQRKISAETVLRIHGPPPEGGNFWT